MGTAETKASQSGRFGRVDESIVTYVISIGLFFLVWWIASLFFPPILLPAPMDVFQKVVYIVVEKHFFQTFGITFYRVIISFVISIVLATAVGIMMGSNERLEDFFEPYVQIGLTVPALAVAMITLLLFGINSTAVISAVVIAMAPSMTENVWHGTKDIDPELNRMANVFHFSRYNKIKDVVLPQLIPYLLSATRFGLGVAWKVVVVVEYLGMGNGIGYQINLAFQQFSFDGVLAWTLAFTALMFAIEFGIIKPVEIFLTRWRVDVEGAEL